MIRKEVGEPLLMKVRVKMRLVKMIVSVVMMNGNNRKRRMRRLVWKKWRKVIRKKKERVKDGRKMSILWKIEANNYFESIY